MSAAGRRTTVLAAAGLSFRRMSTSTREPEPPRTRGRRRETFSLTWLWRRKLARRTGKFWSY